MKTYTAPDTRRITGVQVKPLRAIADERGWLMEILRRDETELLPTFGQVYVSATYPGVVKAWHYHKKQVDNFACVAGMVKLVLVDTRDDSPTNGVVNEFFIGSLNPMLAQHGEASEARQYSGRQVDDGWKCPFMDPRS